MKFAWYDFWIGAYWDRKTTVLYVCLLPMLPVRIPMRWLVGPRAPRTWGAVRKWEAWWPSPSGWGNKMWRAFYIQVLNPLTDGLYKDGLEKN